MHASETGSPLTPRPLQVAISGASGFIGSAVCARLRDLGHEVLPLVRRRARTDEEIAWSPDKGLLRPDSLEPFDVLVHLAGETISKRWTDRRKQKIRDSRVEGTKNLVESLRRMPRPPRRLVCASAIGVYGSQGDVLVDETSPPGAGFLATVGKQWEAAARSAEDFVDDVVRTRFGVVLSPQGGALAKMLPPFRYGIGGVIGDGTQTMSWVSLDDAAKAVVFAATTLDPAAVYNVVAPNPVTNREFTKALAGVLSRPSFMPLPGFVARILFGEMADEMLLASTNVDCRALREAGFQFRDPELGPTLERML